MTKPVIVTRASNGSALTWAQGDTNLTNLRDATVTIKADTGGTDVVSDLNGTLTLVAGNNIMLTGDNTAKTITIDSATPNLNLDDLSDVTATGATNGQVLTYNSTMMTWGASSPAGGASQLGDLTDVYFSGPPSNGDALVYNSTSSKWEPTAISSGASTLDGLSDVVITSAATNDALIFNGTNWVDTALSGVTVGVASTVSLTADDSTNATNYPLFVNAATGNLSPRTDTEFTYNPSTNVMTVGGTALPGSTGTTGQVLALSSAGTAAWATPSSGAKVVVLTFSSAADSGGGVQKCNVTETLDTGGICTISGYNFTLPAGTYTISSPSKYQTSINASWTAGTYDWVSVSGDATISGIATSTKPTSTTAMIWQTKAVITLTQTSTFYQNAPASTAFYNSSAIPQLWTFTKVA